MRSNIVSIERANPRCRDRSTEIAPRASATTNSATRWSMSQTATRRLNGRGVGGSARARGESPENDMAGPTRGVRPVWEAWLGAGKGGATGGWKQRVGVGTEGGGGNRGWPGTTGCPWEAGCFGILDRTVEQRVLGNLGAEVDGVDRATS